MQLKFICTVMKLKHSAARTSVAVRFVYYPGVTVFLSLYIQPSSFHVFSFHFFFPNVHQNEGRNTRRPSCCVTYKEKHNSTLVADASQIQQMAVKQPHTRLGQSQACQCWKGRVFEFKSEDRFMCVCRGRDGGGGRERSQFCEFTIGVSYWNYRFEKKGLRYNRN